MPSSPDEAARQYRAALLALAQHEEARTLATQAAHEARVALSAVAPGHPYLGMSPEEITHSLGGLGLHPLQALVEIFLRSSESARSVSPEAALLAGSLAVTQARLVGSPPVGTVLRRVLEVASRQALPAPEP
ncbi:hypothetical protein [Caldinitratiruptor microaerophilus]|uniref:Uncharacterized protein n=1 Tax=Caldinitratiruptor microaerophilus TaxID=671077 RepID=A0AA35CJS7_9FIRM|nr:hypothetical protein [Caldinitratiruptor microaerophilus]BDG59769.1 hypothetical protein caldi_08590 [Caldinitratiruptor microaerophilus]